MDNKIKVLILAKSLDGGTGTFALSLSKLRKFNLRLLSFEKPKFRKIKAGKASFLGEQYPQKYIFGTSFSSFLRDILRFRRLVKKYRPEVVLAVESHANLMTEIGKILFGFKYQTILVTLIDLEKTIKRKSSRFTYRLLKKAISFFYPKANSLVAISEGVAKGLRKDFGIKKNVQVIYLGIPLKKSSTTRRLGRRRTIVSVARLVEQKDHLTLIKAVKIVIRRLPQARLLIASDGPLKERLQRFVMKNRLVENIKFLGWVDNLSKVYQQADLFVLSTKREGFGYVLVEAMAFSLPVISSDVDYGPREVLSKGKYGILVPPGNVRLLGKAIISLLSDHKKYAHYSFLARKRALMFREKEMLKRYSRLISSLVKPK